MASNEETEKIVNNGIANDLRNIVRKNFKDVTYVNKYKKNVLYTYDRINIENKSQKFTSEDNDLSHMNAYKTRPIFQKVKSGKDIYDHLYSMINSSNNSLENIVRRTSNLETDSTHSSYNHSKNFFDYFDRWYSVHPDYELSSLCHYVFLTKPDLNIKDSRGNLTSVCESVPFFKMVNRQNPHILNALCQNCGSNPTGTTFIPMLVSRTHSLQLPDVTLQSSNLSQPYTGYIIPYASHAIASRTGGEFDITFREYADLTIHKLFNTWIYYIDGVIRNKWTPKLEYIDNDYGIVCDYMISVYDIICAPDASSIIFMAKYTGCLPTSVPNSTLSFNLGDRPDNNISIPFKYFHCDVMEPGILSDFNINAGFKAGDKLPMASEAKAINISNYEYGTGSGFVKRPFIIEDNAGMYYLKWESI